MKLDARLVIVHVPETSSDRHIEALASIDPLVPMAKSIARECAEMFRHPALEVHRSTDHPLLTDSVVIRSEVGGFDGSDMNASPEVATNVVIGQYAAVCHLNACISLARLGQRRILVPMDAVTAKLDNWVRALPEYGREFPGERPYARRLAMRVRIAGVEAHLLKDEESSVTFYPTWELLKKALIDEGRM